MASRFKTFSEDGIWAINEAVVQRNTRQATNLIPECLLIVKKYLLSDVFNLQKIIFVIFIQLIW